MNKAENNMMIQIYKKLKKDRKSLMIILIGFIGILLIFFSELTEKSETDNAEIQPRSLYSSDVQEKELEQIISKVKGVGKVKVLITYEGTSESVYASDFSEQIRGDEAKKDGEHIIIDKGNTEDGLLLREIFPHVTGVAVVCEGGGNPTVKNEITFMLKALFDISSNSISISEMNS